MTSTREKPAAVPRKGNLWRTVMAVAWSFLGVRKESAYQEDIVKLTPLHIIGVGLLLGVLLVVGLIVLVNVVVAA